MAEHPSHPATDELRRRWRTALLAARADTAHPDTAHPDTARTAGAPQAPHSTPDPDRNPDPDPDPDPAHAHAHAHEQSPPDPEPYADTLLARWAEPQRRYHSTDHLVAVLDRVDLLAEHAAHPELVRLAAWFHDAVYRPDRSGNEERSAALAERALTEAGLPPGRAAEVARLVLLTVDHAPGPDDPDGEVLCDADLGVLAAPPADYAAYAAAVREEYRFVPDDLFRAGRSDVLRALLALPSLFHTPHGRTHWEAPARHNLTTELELLSS